MMKRSLISIFPYEGVFQKRLTEMLEERFWCHYEEMMNQSFRSNKEAASVEILPIQDLRLKTKDCSHVLIGTYQEASIFSTQILEVLGMQEEQVLIPIAKMTSDFDFDFIGIVSKNHRQEYVLFSFLEDYTELQKKATQELIKVFMRYESNFTQETLQQYASIYIHQYFDRYIDFDKQSFWLELIDIHAIHQLMSQLLLEQDDQDNILEIRVALYDYLIELFHQTPTEKMTDWLDGDYFFFEDGSVKRDYLESYVYEDKNFVIRFDDYGNAYFYLKLNRTFIQENTILHVHLTADEGIEVDNHYEERFLKRLKERYKAELLMRELSFPTTEFEKRRIKKLLENN